jgi:transcriptional regulator with GAF, ATPase, and Fis domain
MPEDLVDAELFGHAKGAFTGAAVERLGLFESADQGTVFLDEVGELSTRAQAKLLRVLQEGEIRRIGENFTRSIDARLIAATNRSLGAEVEAGRFRQDLLYRLDVIRIRVPPLRERVEDIPLLAARFWRQAAERVGSRAVLGPGALSALARYDWPGNVRELQNVLTAMVVAVPARGVVGASHMPAAIARASKAVALETLDLARFHFEQRFVRAALARTAGHRAHTAAALGLSRQGLAKLMQRLGIE